MQVNGDYVESWQPQAMTPAALARARDIAAAVTGNLGGRGIFGVELFVKGDKVWFSEVSPRPHDTGLVTLATQRLSEFELHARAILGLPVDIALRRPGASAVIYGGMEATGIAFEGVAEALRRAAQPTCACSASRKRSRSAAWASPWPMATPPTKRGSGRSWRRAGSNRSQPDMIPELSAGKFRLSHPKSTSCGARSTGRKTKKPLRRAAALALLQRVPRRSVRPQGH